MIPTRRSDVPASFGPTPRSDVRRETVPAASSPSSANALADLTADLVKDPTLVLRGHANDTPVPKAKSGNSRQDNALSKKTGHGAPASPTKLAPRVAEPAIRQANALSNQGAGAERTPSSQPVSKVPEAVREANALSKQGPGAERSPSSQPVPKVPEAVREANALSKQGPGAERTPSSQPVPKVPEAVREANSLSKQGPGAERTPSMSAQAQPSFIFMPTSTGPLPVANSHVNNPFIPAPHVPVAVAAPKTPEVVPTVVKPQTPVARPDVHAAKVPVAAPKSPVVIAPTVVKPQTPVARPDVHVAKVPVAAPKSPVVIAPTVVAPETPVARPDVHVAKVPVAAPKSPVVIAPTVVAPQTPVARPDVRSAAVPAQEPVFVPKIAIPQSEVRVQQVASPNIVQANVAVVPKKTAARHNDTFVRPKAAVVPQSVEPAPTFVVTPQPRSSRVAVVPGQGSRINPSRNDSVRLVRLINPKAKSGSHFYNFMKYFAIAVAVCVVAICIFAILPVVLL